MGRFELAFRITSGFSALRSNRSIDDVDVGATKLLQSYRLQMVLLCALLSPVLGRQQGLLNGTSGASIG